MAHLSFIFACIESIHNTQLSNNKWSGVNDVYFTACASFVFYYSLHALLSSERIDDVNCCGNCHFLHLSEWAWVAVCYWATKFHRHFVWFCLIGQNYSFSLFSIRMRKFNFHIACCVEIYWIRSWTKTKLRNKTNE